MLICLRLMRLMCVDVEPGRAVGAAAPCDAGGVGLAACWAVERAQSVRFGG